MTSFFIAEGGGRVCNWQKFETGRISPRVLKIEHTFAQVRSSMIYNLTMRCYLCSQQGMNAPSLPGKFYLHRKVVGPSWREELCVTMLSMPDNRKGPCSLSVKLLSFSLVNAWSSSNQLAPNSIVLQLLLLTLHPHTSYNLTGCAIYSTRGRFCFHHGQNRKLHVLPRSSSLRNKKWRHHALLVHWQDLASFLCTN